MEECIGGSLLPALLQNGVEISTCAHTIPLGLLSCKPAARHGMGVWSPDPTASLNVHNINNQKATNRLDTCTFCQVKVRLNCSFYLKNIAETIRPDLKYLYNVGLVEVSLINTGTLG